MGVNIHPLFYYIRKVGEYMPFIYKPIRQFMTPNDTTIDPKKDNRFECVINGQTCIGYRFRVYDMQNNLIESASTQRESTQIYYNVSSVNMAQDTLYINSNNLNNGDKVTLITDGTLPTPLKPDTDYYIGNFKFGKFNLFNSPDDINDYEKRIDFLDSGIGNHTIIYDTPIYNGETLSIILEKNKLSPGNSYKWAVELFANDLEATTNEILSDTVASVDITGDTITLTADNNLVAGDSVTIQSTEKVPSPLVSDTTYFVGSIEGKKIKLYNYRDDAINGGTPIDITDVGSGTITVFKNSSTIKIPNHNLVTGDTVYLFGEKIPKPLAEYTKYYVRKIDNDTISLFNYIEGSRNDAGRIGITETGEFSFTVSNMAESEQIVFLAYDMPTLTLKSATINQQSYTFKPEYYHPQGVMISNFRALMRSGISSMSTISNQDYEVDSGIQENIKLQYTFDGLLSGNAYLVKFIVTTKVGQTVETDWTPFQVSYLAPDLGVKPEAINREDIASVEVKWSGIKQIVGEPNGEMEFVENFVKVGNYGLKMYPYSYLTYSSLDIQLGSSPPMFWWNPSSDNFTGIIMRCENSLTGKYIEVGYNGTNFYRIIDGITFNNAPLPISKNIVYMIGITRNELIVNVVAAM